MAAVMLRDMRTRFFNHGLGFLGVSIWPLCHFGMLLVIYSAIGRTAPFGDSLNIFFATGLIPTLLFMYVSRFMSVSLMLNRPMMAFPAVKILDIMFARACLEIVAAFVTLMLVVVIFLALGEHVMPSQPTEAVLAYLSSMFLAVGVGALAGVISMCFDFFVIIYGLSTILVYISSGTLFVGAQLPERVAYALSWNPVFQCVEWMRTAYFETYSDKFLDRLYPTAFGASCLVTALCLERMLRRRLME